MFGKNPKARQGPEHPETYSVKEVFTTFQGEGPYAGWPAVFVRMGGCNLACFYCDTEFSRGLSTVTPEQLLQDIREEQERNPGARLVVFTGGEPMLQDLRPIIQALFYYQMAGQVQVETAGTVMWPNWPHHLAPLVVSPKTPKVNAEVAREAVAWKYILRASGVDPRDGLPAYSTQEQGKEQPVARPGNRAPVYVQPCDEQSPDLTERNTDIAIRVALNFGYRLSFQVHKMVNMP
jgi:organic radical activating enzyme